MHSEDIIIRQLKNIDAILAIYTSLFACFYCFSSFRILQVSS